MTAQDMVPVSPLVDVIAGTIAEHRLNVTNEFCVAEGCDWASGYNWRDDVPADFLEIDDKFRAHQARAVLAALTEAGNVEWAVQDPTDGKLGAVTGNPDDIQEMREQIAEAKKHDIDVQLVSRFTGTWTAVTE